MRVQVPLPALRRPAMAFTYAVAVVQLQADRLSAPLTTAATRTLVAKQSFRDETTLQVRTVQLACSGTRNQTKAATGARKYSAKMECFQKSKSGRAAA